MHAVSIVIVMTVVMVRLGLEVHDGMRVLASISHHHGNAGMSQRLPAHAKHQDEGGQATAHRSSLSRWIHGRSLAASGRGLLQLNSLRDRPFLLRAVIGASGPERLTSAYSSHRRLCR